MKNFQIFNAPKYQDKKRYTKIQPGIYKRGDEYVTSLTFEMEHTKPEEDTTYQKIPQYPLEDLLDEYLVYVTDSYKDLNKNSKKTCYLEFASEHLEDIENLLTIIRKKETKQWMMN